MKLATSATYLLTTCLLILVLSACSISAIPTPNRPIEISVDDALSAQTALSNSLTTGVVTLTEAELSSFLTKLLEANTGPDQPVESIITWIEPDNFHIRVTWKDDVSMAGGGKTVDLIATLAIVDDRLHLEVDRAASGAYVVSGAMLEPVVAQINSALAQQMPLPPLEITQETGVLTVSLAAAEDAS
jgi:hypothetical protein